MRLSYAFLANAADASTGKINVLGGDFDTIRATAFPAMHATMAVVIGMRGPWSDPDPMPDRLSVQILSPQGEPLAEATGPVHRKLGHGPERKLAAIVQFVGAFFPTPGDYAVVVKVDDEELTRLPLRLVQVEQPVAGPVEEHQPEGART